MLRLSSCMVSAVMRIVFARRLDVLADAVNALNVNKSMMDKCVRTQN